MRRVFYKLVLVSMLILSAGIFAGCYSPNPLYGKWADNKGSSISFSPDLTFSAAIIDSNLDKQNYEGTYNVIDNVIAFTKSTGGQTNTEWDIRGSILYLTWTDDRGNTLQLNLYHVSK